MERWKRLFYYLLINIAVSACTILTVLVVWERLHPPQALAPVTVVATPTATITTDAPSGEGAPAETGGTTVANATSAPIEATETAVSEAVSGQETYTVRSGDTLGAIADAYGVTVDEIVAANNMENPNVLDVGDVLIIPVPATSAETATPETQPTNTLAPPTPGAVITSTPLPPGFDPQVEIVTVVAAGNLSDERVVIRLNGDGSLALRDWHLEDESGHLYVFPELTLFKDGAVTVYTKAGTNNVVELFWGLGEAVWVSGETVSLVDPQGKVQATYQVP